MFILKRQQVEISTIQHPKHDRQSPILTYQGQRFRLIKAFGASQGEEAKAFWRDLTDNRGKACVLLEEPEQELLRLGKEYFGNTHFAEGVRDTLQDMPDC